MTGIAKYVETQNANMFGRESDIMLRFHEIEEYMRQMKNRDDAGLSCANLIQRVKTLAKDGKEVAMRNVSRYRRADDSGGFENVESWAERVKDDAGDDVRAVEISKNVLQM
jgi:hypothetical protein